MPAPRILVTNDDGVASPGLHALARAMVDHGEVVVVAPDQEYSGASAALGTLWAIEPVARRAAVEGVGEAWSVTGPPGLCVTLACMGAFGRQPDLVVSGINPGENVGRAVYHSGTVGAGITARIRGVPSIAVSQKFAGAEIEGQGARAEGEQLWGTAADAAGTVAEAVLADLPAAAGFVVNLNVPNLPPGRIRAWRSTTLAVKPSRALASARLLPRDSDPDTFEVEMLWGASVDLPRETDAGAVAAGEISVTLLGRLGEHPPASALPGLAGRLGARWPEA